MPGHFELKPTLAKIWHAPDNFRILEPLPPMHRRGIIIAAIVMVIGFLLPASETSDVPVVHAGSAIGSAIVFPGA
ncbi:Putative cell envelope opacity-associated proteinA [Salmonella enterica subsp. arizonae]|uniref:Cell envelope opacity-associated proteinA n=1 Tax=Salmonella enterica subsp. arizonae TaxID=59203 RepID=A0A379TQE8_SALER|nr:Putative cell envelope opacity-associated proteinA [Salmonella enterica subsp. arizonae]